MSKAKKGIKTPYKQNKKNKTKKIKEICDRRLGDDEIGIVKPEGIKKGKILEVSALISKHKVHRFLCTPSGNDDLLEKMYNKDKEFKLVKLTEIDDIIVARKLMDLLQKELTGKLDVILMLKGDERGEMAYFLYEEVRSKLIKMLK